MRRVGESTPDLTMDVFLDALRRAATAHGVHESEDLGGVYDESWAEWYAAHMAAELEEYDLQGSDLARLLRNAAERHATAADAHPEEWPQWYATHMLPALKAPTARSVTGE